MVASMDNQITTQQATVELFRLARRVPFNIAPERAEQLATEILGSGKWTLASSDTEDANFYAVVQDKTIYLSHSGQASLWCLAFAAYHIVDIASRRQRDTEGRSEQYVVDIGAAVAALRLGEYVAYARSLFHKDLNWPSNLHVPNVAANDGTADWSVNNVYFGALSWILLHEIAHVHHNHELFVPAYDRVRQEYVADDFATDWALNSAGQGLQREFRILMITVALTWLFLRESELGRGTTHPAAINRFRSAAGTFRAKDRSVGLENAAYVLKAILDPESTPPRPDSALDSFNWISKRLEHLYGR